MMANKSVDYRFKILYALGIIFVVAGHCGNGGVSLLYDWFPIYSFHLGLFAFSSGYFYKSSAENNLGKYIGKKVKSLLIPLYVWNALYAVFVSVLELKGFTIGSGVTLEKLLLAPITDGHQFIYNMGGWFMIPLFMVEVVNAVIRTLLRKICEDSAIKEIAIFTAYLSLGMIGVYIASVGCNTGMWLVLTRMLYFLPFYGMGVFYRKLLEKYDKAPNIIYFAAIFLAQIIILLKYKRIPIYTPSWCNDFYDGPVLPFVVGFLGIFFWLRVASILEPAIGRSKLVNLIADNTYTIAINHIAAFMVVKTCFALLNRYTGLCEEFDWFQYKTEWGYLYLPNEMNRMLIIYLTAGICLPILLQMILNKIRDSFGQHSRKQNEK